MRKQVTKLTTNDGRVEFVLDGGCHVGFQWGDIARMGTSNIHSLLVDKGSHAMSFEKFSELTRMVDKGGLYFDLEKLDIIPVDDGYQSKKHVIKLADKCMGIVSRNTMINELKTKNENELKHVSHLITKAYTDIFNDGCEIAKHMFDNEGVTSGAFELPKPIKFRPKAVDGSSLGETTLRVMTMVACYNDTNGHSVQFGLFSSVVNGDASLYTIGEIISSFTKREEFFNLHATLVELKVSIMARIMDYMSKKSKS